MDQDRSNLVIAFLFVIIVLGFIFLIVHHSVLKGFCNGAVSANYSGFNDTIYNDCHPGDSTYDSFKFNTGVKNSS